MKETAGIHHITAIVGHPQENVDFYAGVLGLRMVKKTVNFDDPGTYHLYFGDDQGAPGTIITFFPWADARQGVIGDGQVGVTTYLIPKGAMEFWENRLDTFKVDYEKTERFGENYLSFKDPHGLQLEFVERSGGQLNTWEFAHMTSDVAIKGFGGAILFSANPEETGKVLTNVMGLKQIDQTDDLLRFQSTADIGNVIDIKLTTSGRGQMGVGTVHHIAWRAKDAVDHQDWQQHVKQSGFPVTEIRDRNYFDAIYFKEPGDILFEIATDPPGFAHDESLETMGQSLKLPKQYEEHRQKLEEILIPIQIRNIDPT